MNFDLKMLPRVTVEVLHNTRSVQIFLINFNGAVAPKLRLEQSTCLAIVEAGSFSWTCLLPKNVMWSHPVQLIQGGDHAVLRLALEPFGPCESVLLQSKSREAPESVVPKLQQANNQLKCRLCEKVTFIEGSPFSKVCFPLFCGKCF